MKISTLALCVGASLPPRIALAQCLDGTPPDCVRRAGTMAGRSTVYAPHAMIATSQPLASAAGLAVLQRGGNAIDAAVTAAAVLAVVEPHMTGVGGDMFAMLWSAREGHLVALNASGRSGSLLTREELVRRGRRTMPQTGAETITVPGALSGWAALLQRYGTISLADALAPAIRIAEDGFPVTPVIASEWSDEARKLQRDEGARATFLVEGARTPRVGEWFRNADLAGSLRLIAREGPSALYGGDLGRRIVDRVRSLGGFLTIEDLQNHQPMWVEPISAPFKGYRVWELPPNNQGVAVLEMLRMLEPFDLAGMGHNSARYLHTLVEAKKLAYADLARYVGDPDHLTAPPSALLTDEFIARRRALIDTLRAADRVDPGEAQTHSETIYLTAADSSGNMISFINSQYDAFGSGVVVPGTGFSLQDRGAGFTMTEGLPNTVGPRKRPFHTLIPGFVTRTGANGAEEPWLSFGVMGGSVQPQGHVQVLLNLLVFGMDPQQAVDAGRFRHISGRRLALEPVIGADVRAVLAAMGHDIVRDSAVAFGGAQMILRLPHGYAGASDPRKDGLAIGW